MITVTTPFRVCVSSTPPIPNPSLCPLRTLHLRCVLYGKRRQLKYQQATIRNSHQPTYRTTFPGSRWILRRSQHSMCFKSGPYRCLSCCRTLATTLRFGSRSATFSGAWCAPGFCCLSNVVANHNLAGWSSRRCERVAASRRAFRPCSRSR